MIQTDIATVKAERLAEALTAVEVAATFYHEPNGIPCVMVFLNQEDADRDIDADPALFVMVEDSDSYRILKEGIEWDRGWRWTGQLGNMHDFWTPEGGDWLDLGFEFLERTWLGEDEQIIAKQIAMLLNLFKAPQDLPVAQQ